MRSSHSPTFLLPSHPVISSNVATLRGAAATLAAATLVVTNNAERSELTMVLGCEESASHVAPEDADSAPNTKADAPAWACGQ